MATDRSTSPAKRVARALTSDDQLRLMTRVARLYHEQQMTQPRIAEELSLSQPRVSRLLRQASDFGIVRTVVIPPPGVFSDVEGAVRQRFGLRDVVAVDTPGGDADSVIPALGGAAAVYLESTLARGARLGISSWSATLLATVESMTLRPGGYGVESVVQLVGGVGHPKVQVQATRLTGHLADLTGAEPMFMPAPGLVGSSAARRAITADPSVASVMEAWESLTVAVVGIGSLEPSPLLRESGNVVSPEEQAKLLEVGGVGDICMRFFDENGSIVSTPFENRTISIAGDLFRSIPQRIGVAGGERKYTAVRAALRGGWIDVLITDLDTATRLAAEPQSTPAGAPAAVTRRRRS